MHVSLDGFVCGPNGEQDRMAMRQLGGDLLKTVDTMLVGRVLYQGFQSYWPTVGKSLHPKIVEQVMDAIA